MTDATVWPYFPILQRLALALALGLFIGMERERRGKEAGIRTFAFATLFGTVGMLLGENFALLAMGLIGVLVILMAVATLTAGLGLELTTSIALLLTGFIGVLVGQGHTITPTALAVVTAGLLAWKRALNTFTVHLTEEELRSAILLAVLALVIYPALPVGTVGPYDLLNPRAAWITVILIAAIGFGNYILLKLYGTRGLAIAGFLGGLVNSTVVATELANRHREAPEKLRDATYQGVILAGAAMLLRNGVLLAVLSPEAAIATLPAFLVMIAASLALAWVHRDHQPDGTVNLALRSPFAISSALKFGVLFLALEIAGDLGQRGLGQSGFYAVSLVGGLVSSASSVASAGLLASHGTLAPHVAGIGAVLASLSSAIVDLPVIERLGRDPHLTRRLALAVALISALGVAGALAGVWLIP
ncbi:MAG TPA: MgtC/SapB family protein [Nitrolancea sp.]|nr:MgtC/SapB family protein [Nitrolancea sp.]